MNIVNNRYPPYPYRGTALLEPRGYSTRSGLEAYGRDRYYERPDVPRSRSYLTCSCGMPSTARGDHLCRSCLMVTSAANRVLDVRGGDHCDCPQCSLANIDDDREVMMERYSGYYSPESEICRSCGRRNCPLDHRNRLSIAGSSYGREAGYISPRTGRPVLGSRAFTIR